MQPLGSGRTGAVSLRGRALRLLSQRDYSHAEMVVKLTPHCNSPEELQALLADLADKGWVNDQRAAESLVRRQAGKYGAARIRRDLQTKGVSREVIADALTELADSELARATAVWSKKFRSPPETPDEQARQVRFLLARGFTSQVIRQVIRGADECPADGGAET